MYALEQDEIEESTGIESLPTLRRGMINASVGVLQHLLTTAGYPLIPDNNFGPKTEQAVKSLQADVDLTQTGVVDADTWEALREVVTPTTRLPKIDQSSPGMNWERWGGLGLMAAGVILLAMTLWPRSTHTPPPRRTRRSR